MYEFTKTELDFLKRFGNTGNGKELLSILQRMKTKSDSTIDIPTGADYGAEVEGRKIVNKLFTSMIEAMVKKESISERREVGIDEYN